VPEGGFPAFLARSLDLLEREVPEAFGVLCARLARRTVFLDVDGERIQLRFGARVALGPPEERAHVAVTTTRRTILDVVDRGTSLADAVLADLLVLVGAPADLLAFHDGLLDYVHGAVRAPSFPGLLAEFRTAAGGTP
jgi:hypothetical protein